jgi:hypothetical protein
MVAIYSNGGNRRSILGFNFTKRDALSSVYKISMVWCHTHVLLKLIFPCLKLKQPFDVLLAVCQTGV